MRHGSGAARRPAGKTRRVSRRKGFCARWARARRRAWRRSHVARGPAKRPSSRTCSRAAAAPPRSDLRNFDCHGARRCTRHGAVHEVEPRRQGGPDPAGAHGAEFERARCAFVGRWRQRVTRPSLRLLDGLCHCVATDVREVGSRGLGGQGLRPVCLEPCSSAQSIFFFKKRKKRSLT